MTPQLRNPVANKLQLSDVSDPESVLDDIVISLFWVEYYTYIILFTGIVWLLHAPQKIN